VVATTSAGFDELEDVLTERLPPFIALS